MKLLRFRRFFSGLEWDDPCLVVGLFTGLEWDDPGLKCLGFHRFRMSMETCLNEKMQA